MTPEKRAELRAKADAFFFDVTIRPCATLLTEACDEIDRLQALADAVGDDDFAAKVAGQASNRPTRYPEMDAIALYRGGLNEAAQDPHQAHADALAARKKLMEARLAQLLADNEARKPGDPATEAYVASLEQEIGVLRKTT